MSNYNSSSFQNIKIRVPLLETPLTKSNSNELTLGSLNKETFNSSLLKSTKEGDVLKDHPDIIKKYISFCFSTEPRGGIIKFKQSKDENSEDVDTARYMDYVVDQVVKIQKNYRNHLFSKTSNYKSYKTGVIRILYRSRSLDYLNKRLRKDPPRLPAPDPKPQTVARVQPEIITKEYKNNFPTYNQKKISSTFKFRSAKKIQKSAEENLRLQISGLWNKENELTENNFTLVKKKKEPLICQLSHSFSISSPEKFSRGVNTISWAESNKAVLKNISFQIERVKSQLYLVKNNDFQLLKNPLFWNKKIQIDRENQLKMKFDKRDPNLLNKVCFSQRMQIEKEYETKIWNKVNQIVSFNSSIPRDKLNIFYSLSHYDGVNYDIKLGRNPQNIMYTLCKKDIMLFWNKLNDIDCIGRPKKDVDELKQKLSSPKKNTKDESTNTKEEDNSLTFRKDETSNFSVNLSNYEQIKIEPVETQKPLKGHNKKFIEPEEDPVPLEMDMPIEAPEVQKITSFSSKGIDKKESFIGFAHSQITFYPEKKTQIKEEVPHEIKEEEMMKAVIEKWNKEIYPCQAINRVALFAKGKDQLFWSRKIYPSQEVSLKFLFKFPKSPYHNYFLNNQIDKVKPFTLYKTGPKSFSRDIQTDYVYIPDSNLPPQFEVAVVEKEFTQSRGSISSKGSKGGNNCGATGSKAKAMKAGVTAKSKINNQPRGSEISYSSNSPFYREIQKDASNMVARSTSDLHFGNNEVKSFKSIGVNINKSGK